MMRYRLLFLFFVYSISGFTQNSTIEGTVLDAENNPISFATVMVSEISDENNAEEILLNGTTTDDSGKFEIKGLAQKNYALTISYIGFATIKRSISAPINLGNIVLEESKENLEEAVVNTKRPTINKTAGKLVFNVENTSLSTGSTFDLLKKTPGVVIVGEAIKVKFTNPIIYINNKRVFLSSSEVTSLLQNTDASAIQSIEVITNPSAKFDGVTGTVLNINTSRAISIGYKGSVNANYSQGVYSKYKLGTSHFYKNNWINFYGSYGFNTRKDFKEEESFIRFFELDESINSTWNSDFNRTTRTNAHQGNLISDFTLTEKQSLSIASTFSVNPNETYDNRGFTVIRNAQQGIDSTFTTLSDLETSTHTLSLSADYKFLLDEKNSNVKISANYTDYNKGRLQHVLTNYNNPEGDLLRNNSFFTDADQGTNIFTGQADLTHTLWKGTVETGIKYSNIDSNSKLDFFDTDMGAMQLNTSLSDNFNYLERIYASYLNFAQEFGKFSLNAGLRGEYTDIDGSSRSLGQTNTDTYFNLFPRAFVKYNFNERHTTAVSYTKSISRPGYQNLNPFRYFINENNFNEGNPLLVPAISDRIALNYSYNNVWTFEVYYENIDNSLRALTFQDTAAKTLRNTEANLLRDFQYSFDIQYAPQKLPSWLYIYVITSTYYLENKFLALESIPRTSTNSTAGFYGYIYANFALTKDRSWMADLTSQYFSNLIYGSSDYNNVSFVNISLKKSFWNNKATVTMGVDDVFNKSGNRPIVSKYLNQDNFYAAQNETRLFFLGLQYNFGNARLRDNQRNLDSQEKKRLEKP